ncbi:MAG: amino acid ABC transporter substrate-binding protein [Thermoprotei archaeon]|nr:MAG: amino acid ABC transporter substrate-binding protein [Thermoprotei archaeon]
MLQEQLNPKLVEKIKARGKLIVGTSADWPPFEYIDEKGEVVGIDIEIAKRIAAELGVELEIKDMKFAALIEALKNGLVDIVIADMTPTPEREQVVDFSIPYYFSKGNALITLKGKEVTSINDLKGKKVGVQLGTIQQEWAQENLKDIATIVTYDKVYPEMIMALKRGDISAIIVGDIIGSVLIKKDPELTIAMYVGGEQVGGAVALPQGAEDLKYIVNKVIDKLMTSGELRKIFEDQISKWLGIS